MVDDFLVSHDTTEDDEPGSVGARYALVEPKLTVAVAHDVADPEPAAGVRLRLYFGQEALYGAIH